MQILDGRAAAAQIKADIAAAVQKLSLAGKRPPKLACIMAGSSGASVTYVAQKESACQEVGFNFELIRFSEEACEYVLLDAIQRLNCDSQTDGFIVQMPLPKHISEQRIIDAIWPRKDVDGFHPINAGRMAAGLPCFVPATPMGIGLLLRHYNIETCGKHCVILGRSSIVGRPLSMLLSQKDFNCTTTLCHSATRDIGTLCRSADILVAALGQADFVRQDMVRDGAVVIDVGITRIADAGAKRGFRLKGDVKYDEVAPKCSAITPVPGGVGPMTIAALLKNTLSAYG
jgi:methylenetetrahydrofolate dehydrogenase (NADP+)/methenyltetrahydrofolate cyclohydrolase